MQTGLLNKNILAGRGLLGDVYDQYLADLQSSKNSLAYWESELVRDPESENVKTQIIYFKARIARLQEMISKGRQYLIHTGATSKSELDLGVQKYIKALTKLKNSFENTGGDIFEDTTNFLTQDLAGVPIWGWIAIVGAGLFLFKDNLKRIGKK